MRDKTIKVSEGKDSHPYCLSRNQIIQAMPASNYANTHFKPNLKMTPEELQEKIDRYNHMYDKPTFEEVNNGEK